MKKFFAALPAGVQLAILKPENPAPGLFTNPTGDGSVNSIILRALSMLISLAGVVAAFYMVLGGYYYLTAGSSDDMVKKAKKIMTNSIIGLAGVILAYVILTVVKNAIEGRIGA